MNREGLSVMVYLAGEVGGAVDVVLYFLPGHVVS